MKIHSKMNKFRIKNKIVADLRYLLEIQAIMPEASPFLSAKMAVLSSFFSKVYSTCVLCVNCEL
jgi:hypothetical protein